MPDHIESRMNFIIEQQAQFATDIQLLLEQQTKFAADIQLLKERQSDMFRMIEANAGMIRQLVDVSLSLARNLEETNRRMEEMDRRLGARMDQLAESHAHSDRRLDALIDVVDKLIRRDDRKE